MELERLRGLAPAMRRRVLRAAAEQLGCGLNFEQTERLMGMCAPDFGPGAAGKEQLAAELWAERTARELRLVRSATRREHVAPEPVVVMIPGEGTGMGVSLRLALTSGARPEIAAAILRAPRAGDRVRLRYSRGAKPLKEIFSRINVDAEARSTWPVLEWEGRIVWMKGAAVEADIPFAIELLE